MMDIVPVLKCASKMWPSSREAYHIKVLFARPIDELSIGCGAVKGDKRTFKPRLLYKAEVWNLKPQTGRHEPATVDIYNWHSDNRYTISAETFRQMFQWEVGDD